MKTVFMRFRGLWMSAILCVTLFTVTISREKLESRQQ